MSEENKLEDQKPVETEAQAEVENKPVDVLETEQSKEEFNKIQEERKKIASQYKQMFLHKYDLEKVDLVKEFEKVKDKTSGLSRRQRDAVVAYFQIFKDEE